MKISYVMNVLNGEPFIKYQLESIYKFAHQIIIVEGAYEKYAHAANDNGSSVDNTLSIISNYPDPDCKITLVKNNNKLWPERKEMCNAFLKPVTGDVIWQIDVDEFYHDWVHEYIAELFNTDDELDKVSFCTREFFMSPFYEIKGAYETLDLENVGRVFRYEEGEEWLNQRPPTLGKNNTQRDVRKEITGYELSEASIYMYNYTALFKQQVYDKIKYHNIIDSKTVIDPTGMIDDFWENLSTPINPAMIETIPSYIEKITSSDIPNIIIKMWSELDNEQRTFLKKRNNLDIEEYLKSDEYKKDRRIVIYFNQLFLSLRNRKIFSSFKFLLKYFCYLILFYRTNKNENKLYIKKINNNLLKWIIEKVKI